MCKHCKTHPTIRGFIAGHKGAVAVLIKICRCDTLEPRGRTTQYPILRDIS